MWWKRALWENYSLPTMRRASQRMNVTRTLRILTFTSLYPSSVQPRHGVFVEERLRHLVSGGGVSATVVAPVPWFPSKDTRFGRYAQYAQVPEEENRYGIHVLHPRYPVVPKAGMSLAPWLMARALLPVVRRLEAQGPGFDLIDAHYFYPDGVAAVWLGERICKPVVVTARGSDINWIPRHRLPRLQILRAAKRAKAIVAVSNALGDRMADIGISRKSITVLRNGVDQTVFCPEPQLALALRQELNLEGPVILSVGNLIESKGHHIAIEALKYLGQGTLLIVGEGPMKKPLRKQADAYGLGNRVRLLGAIEHDELPRYYTLADVLVLASRREGMPNVVLEALACGTPVVACDVGGVREVVAEPVAGLVLLVREADALAQAIGTVLAKLPPRNAVRDYARRFSWDETSAGQRELFRSLCSGTKVCQ